MEFGWKLEVKEDASFVMTKFDGGLDGPVATGSSAPVTGILSLGGRDERKKCSEGDADYQPLEITVLTVDGNPLPMEGGATFPAALCCDHGCGVLHGPDSAIRLKCQQLGAIMAGMPATPPTHFKMEENYDLMELSRKT